MLHRCSDRDAGEVACGHAQVHSGQSSCDRDNTVCQQSSEASALQSLRERHAPWPTRQTILIRSPRPPPETQRSPACNQFRRFRRNPGPLPDRDPLGSLVSAQIGLQAQFHCKATLAVPGRLEGYSTGAAPPHGRPVNMICILPDRVQLYGCPDLLGLGDHLDGIWQSLGHVGSRLCAADV